MYKSMFGSLWRCKLLMVRVLHLEDTPWLSQVTVTLAEEEWWCLNIFTTMNSAKIPCSSPLPDERKGEKPWTRPPPCMSLWGLVISSGAPVDKIQAWNAWPSLNEVSFIDWIISKTSSGGWLMWPTMSWKDQGRAAKCFCKVWEGRGIRCLCVLMQLEDIMIKPFVVLWVSTGDKSGSVGRISLMYGTWLYVVLCPERWRGRRGKRDICPLVYWKRWGWFECLYVFIM